MPKLKKKEHAFKKTISLKKKKPSISKEKQTCRYRTHISGYQRGEVWGRGKVGEGGQESQTTSYKINTLQGCNI